MDEESETFVVYVTAVEALAGLAEMIMHPSQTAQIATLKQDKTLTKVLSKYVDYANVFSFDLAMELFENTGISKDVIKLQDGKQPAYRPIYSLGPMELETLKTYIKTYLKTGFIWPSKSSASALILFDKKPDSSLWLCINYWDLNNLTIKNQYPLSLIGKALDWLDKAKQFTQLDMNSAYHRMRIREGNEWKIAFKTWYSHFKYQVMSFGLSNVWASFQDYIKKIPAKKFDVFVIVYLNDFFIYTKDKSQGYVEAVQ